MKKKINKQKQIRENKIQLAFFLLIVAGMILINKFYYSGSRINETSETYNLQNNHQIQEKKSELSTMDKKPNSRKKALINKKSDFGANTNISEEFNDQIQNLFSLCSRELGKIDENEISHAGFPITLMVHINQEGKISKVEELNFENTLIFNSEFIKCLQQSPPLSFKNKKIRTRLLLVLSNLI